MIIDDEIQSRKKRTEVSVPWKYLAQDDADRREVDDVEGKGPLEDLEKQGGDRGRDDPRPGCGP